MSGLVLEDLSPWTDIGQQNPKDFAAGIVTQSRSSFTFGMKILKRPRREAMFAIYAFARTIDDIADGDWPMDVKRKLLDDWREEIEHLFAGNPKGPVSKAMLAPVQTFNLPKQEFLLMIEGMEMDANGPVQGPSMDVLLEYTRRVAGTVGMLSVRIFGAQEAPSTDQFALRLADAFQLTNILRDVEEDAEIDRLYLPKDLLMKHDIPHATPREAAYHPNIKYVCADIGAIARQDFLAARQSLKVLDPKTLRPALMMMGVYEGYLDMLERANWDRSVIPLKMSKVSKLVRGLHYAFFKSFV